MLFLNNFFISLNRCPSVSSLRRARAVNTGDIATVSKGFKLLFFGCCNHNGDWKLVSKLVLFRLPSSFDDFPIGICSLHQFIE